MKPTIEQLNDPAWWDEHSSGYEYVFCNDDVDAIRFADKGGIYKIDNEYDGLLIGPQWQFLAKRPTRKPWVPVTGVECEVYNESFEFAEWEECIPLFVGQHKVVYSSESCDERVCDIGLLKFRPIQSDKEKWVEAAMAEVESPEWTAIEVLETVYDAGLGKLPEESQE